MFDQIWPFACPIRGCHVVDLSFSQNQGFHLHGFCRRFVLSVTTWTTMVLFLVVLLHIFRWEDVRMKIVGGCFQVCEWWSYSAIGCWTKPSLRSSPFRHGGVVACDSLPGAFRCRCAKRKEEPTVGSIVSWLSVDKDGVLCSGLSRVLRHNGHAF